MHGWGRGIRKISVLSAQYCCEPKTAPKKKKVSKKGKNVNRYRSKEDTQIANKHIKRCSTSLAIKEMQIKQPYETISHPLG